MSTLRTQLSFSASGPYWPRYIGLFLSLILSSCALVPDPPPPTRTYLLAPPLPLPKKQISSQLTLLVAPPRAAAGYTSNQMAYTRRPYELNYFSHNQWVDTPSRMLAPILVNALGASGHFQRVAPSHVRMLADLRLETEILRLVQDFSTQPSEGHLILQARIINPRSSKEITSRIFEAREPAPREEPYGGVVALNRALASLLEELAAFCAQAYSSNVSQESPYSPHDLGSHSTNSASIAKGH